MVKLMKETPIIMSMPMVQAILEGRKTQTRRIIKPQPEQKVMGGSPMKALTSLIGENNPVGWHYKGTRYMPWPQFFIDLCCKYQKDDLLWVRETWRSSRPFTGDMVSDYSTVNIYYYAKDNPTYRDKDKWKPSIHMPKSAARIWLKIKGIRVEKLQDISEDDAVAEGVGSGFQMNGGWPDYGRIVNGVCQVTQDTARMSYATLWDKINGKESWELNPWVWVIEFEKTDK